MPQEIVKPMTEEQKAKLRFDTKKNWLGVSNAGIERALRLDQRVKQQIECRIEALTEILYERDNQKDYKSKQYTD